MKKLLSYVKNNIGVAFGALVAAVLTYIIFVA